MTQRCEPRFAAQQPVMVTIYGDPDLKMAARIRNISGRGIGLEFEVPVAPGTALKVELDDSLLLGEVIYCRSEGASYYAGVELEQAMNGLAELSRIVSAFAELGASGTQHADAAVAGGNQNQQ